MTESCPNFPVTLLVPEPDKSVFAILSISSRDCDHNSTASYAKIVQLLMNP